MLASGGMSAAGDVLSSYSFRVWPVHDVLLSRSFSGIVIIYCLGASDCSVLFTAGFSWRACVRLYSGAFFSPVAVLGVIIALYFFVFSALVYWLLM